ncbi:MAG: hypothetical protein R3258_00180 [Acidimicrobiia bacterium]|nr:hypothetical protein [Acidimicrobiia bacterium]
MQPQSTTKTGKGWLLVAVVAGLILLSGIYPAVAEPEDRVMGIAVIVISAVALAMAVRPLRSGDASAWRALLLYPVALVLIAIFLLGEEFQIIFLVLAAVAIIGLWLSRPSRSM